MAGPCGIHTRFPILPLLLTAGTRNHFKELQKQPDYNSDLPGCQGVVVWNVIRRTVRNPQEAFATKAKDGPAESSCEPVAGRVWISRLRSMRERCSRTWKLDHQEAAVSSIAGQAVFGDDCSVQLLIDIYSKRPGARGKRDFPCCQHGIKVDYS